MELNGRSAQNLRRISEIDLGPIIKLVKVRYIIINIIIQVHL